MVSSTLALDGLTMHLSPRFPRTIFSSILVLLAANVPAAAQRTGRPAADLISRLTQPREVSVIGNAVDTGTGNFSLEASVIQVHGGRTLDFTAVHDSLTTPAAIIGQPLLLGVGWTHPYAARVQGRPGGPVTVHWDDHRSNRFGFSSGSYPPLDESNRYDRLEEVNGIFRCNECTWRVTREDGTMLAFDSNGVLKVIGNKINQLLLVEKSLGRVERVREPISDREIEFTYGDANRIRFVSDPAGRRAYFQYDELGRLTAIHNPSTVSDLLLQPAVILPIPDNGVLEQDITISNRPDEAGIVLLPGTRFSHSRPSDVQVTLSSPTGRVVDITDFAEHPTPTVFNYEDVILNQFQGDQANGTWTLRIRDMQPGATGEAFGFTVQVSEPTFPTFFRYSDAGQIAEAIDANGDRIFANNYDALGRVVAQDDGRAETPLARFAYQETAQGVVTTYTDRLGHEYRFEHDMNYRLLRYLDPLEAETRYEYAFNGDRTAIIDALDRRTSFEYDGNGNITRVTDAAGNLTRMSFVGKNLSSFTDAEGAVTNFTFNNGNITSVNDAEGHQDTRRYNGNGQLNNVILDDGAGMDINYTGGQATSGQMLRGPFTGGADYDEIGLPSEIEDGAGMKTLLDYDGRGNVIRRTDPLGNVESMEYDARNRLVRMVDKNGNVARTQYDGNGNVVSRTDALGHTTQLVYDDGDRLVELIDAMGNSATRDYDAVGRLISETDAAGNTTRRRYDRVGNVVSLIDAKGVVASTTVYDEVDLPIATTDALGNVAQTRFDRVQRPTEFVDPLGRVTRLTYDKIGRLLRVDDPSGRFTTQRFFGDDVLAGMTDGSGAETQFSYEDQNRVRQFTPATGSIAQITWEYDERGLPVEEDLPGSAEKNYEYDDASRLTRVEYSGEGARATKQYAYDPNGNLTTVRSGGAVRLRRTFDALNRVTSYRDAHGDTLRYAYDPNGNLQRLTYPDGKTVEYEYDEANRLIAAVDWAQRRTSFSYDANSQLTDIGFPNGTSRRMEYDEAGRLVRRRDFTSGGVPIVDYRYTYDPLGMLSEEYSGAPAQPAYQPAAMSFTYRNDGRFQTINGSPATYDPRRNLTSLPGGSAAYDADGNLIRSPDGSYEYDAEDRLVAWTKAGGRTRFTVNPHADLDQILVQRAPNGSTMRFVFAGGLLYEESGDGIRVFHYDHRGSAVAFTGANGTMVGSAAYGPYGELIQQDGQAQSIFLFCGLYGVVSDGSGLNYMRFRWYSPDLKRFLTPDSHYGDIADPSSLNLYAYAGNNPVNFIDPRGEFIGALVGAVAGAVVGVVSTVVTAAVTGQPLTAGDLIGAAVGGAVTGGLLGLCGPVCAGGAGLILSGIGAGAVGGAIGNAVGQGVDILTNQQQGFDWGAFGAEVGLSAAFGALPFGRGAKGGARAASRASREAAEAATKRGSKSAVSKLLRGGASAKRGGDDLLRLNPPKLGGKTPVPKIPTRLKHLEPPPPNPWVEAAFNGPLDTLVGIGQGYVGHRIEQAQTATAPGSDGSNTTDAHSVRQAGNRELNEGRRSFYGEYAAWNFYQAVHTLAGRPLPNNPNPALPQF